MKIAIFATLLLLTACTAGMSEEEIKTAVINANTGINHYKVDSQIDVMSQAQGQSITMTMDMQGEINRDERKAHISSDTEMKVGGFQTTLDQETYVIENYVYTQILDNWVKMESEGTWDDQDQVEQYTTLMENGDFEVRGTQNIDGTEYYVVEMTLTKEFLGQYLSSTSNDEQFEGLDFSDYDITFYVNTETFVIERNSGVLSVSQTVAGQEISMDMEISTRIYDINEVNNIEIPEEALQAEDYSSNLIGSY